MGSIRRIKLSQLTVGMYITEVSDEIALQSGLKVKGLVTREDTVKLLQTMDVTELYIDISKGCDCQGSESVSALRKKHERELAKVSLQRWDMPQVSFEEEFKNAVEVRQKAFFLAKDVMHDVKMGKGFDSHAVDVISTEIVESLTSNQNALNSLMRIRHMDQYLLEHSTNVAVLMGVLARSMDIKGEQLHKLVFGAFVHDVGKILVPDHILNKPGRLTPEEWQEMKRHVDYGVDSLQPINDISPLAIEICAQHHEKLDGSGYPAGLNASQITEHGKMAAVVDIYDAVTAHRVYHLGMEPTEALKKMLEWSGGHLEKDLVYQLIRCISLYPAGAWVVLASGYVAMVREANLKKPTRPVVLLAYDSKRNVRVQEQVVDLATIGTYGEIRGATSPEAYGLNSADYLPL